jgi:hypothetical protein
LHGVVSRKIKLVAVAVDIAAGNAVSRETPPLQNSDFLTQSSQSSLLF